MLHTDNFQHMIGTTRTEVRKLNRDTYVTLTYVVEGVRFKGATRHTKDSVTVWGRCIEWPEESTPFGGNTSWHGAFCSEVFYENPEQTEEQPETPETTVEQISEQLESVGFTKCSVEQTERGEIRHSGFHAFEADGQTNITYTLGSWADDVAQPERFRTVVEQQISDMERYLTRDRGYTVTMFIPDTGIGHFRLTVA